MQKNYTDINEYFDFVRQRQAEGIAAAKLRGVHIGRPKKTVPENFGELVKLWESKVLKTSDMLLLCKMSRANFYRRLKEYRQSLEMENKDKEVSSENT